MKISFVLTAGAAAVTLVMSTPSSAATLQFVFSGPSGTASFQLNSNPTPDFASSFLGSDDFGFNNVAGTYDGKPGTASTISFGNGLFASLSIAAPGLGFTQFAAPTLFSGPPTEPVFQTGSFTLINPFFGNGTLSITAVAAAVPEAASWAMMIVGLGVAGGTMRYRRRRAKVCFA